MLHGLLRRLAAGIRPERRRRDGPVCRVTLDLRSMSWADTPEIACDQLRARPGVLDVKMDAGRGEAVVWHDGQTSFPQLFNWLQAQSDRVGNDDRGDNGGSHH